MMIQRRMIPVCCVVFRLGVDQVFGTLILPAMAAYLYLFLLLIRRLIQLEWGFLKEAQQ